MATQIPSVMCFLCNEKAPCIGARLVTSTIPLSETTLAAKIEQLLGDNFRIIVGKDDKLCIRCYKMLIRFNKLESDLDVLRISLRGFLNVKYNLENFSDNVQVDDPFTLSEEVSEFLEEDKSDRYKKKPIKIISEDVQILPVASQSTKFKCNVCDFKSINQAIVLSHLRTVHKSTVMFKCATCVKRFASRTAIQRHIVRAHGGTQQTKAPSSAKAVRYRCGLCSATYPSQPELVEHFHVHCEKEPHPVYESLKLVLRQMPPTQDDGGLLTASNLDPGELTDDGLMHRIKSELEYAVDGEVLDFAQLLPPERVSKDVREILPKPPTDVHECAECGLRAFCEQEMRTHIATEHSRRYECPLCTCQLSSSSNLRRHLERHDATPVECRQCHITLPDKLHLRAHTQEVHSQEFRCATCSSVLPSMALLRLHEASHLAKGQAVAPAVAPAYACPTCGKMLCSPKSLRRHKEIHERQVGAAHCAVCGLTCLNVVSLREHLTQEHGHTVQLAADQSEVSCDDCGKKFSTERRLQRHKELSHRPPGCRVCGKVLTPVRKLIAHERRHENSTPHPCPECNKVFKTLTGLRFHSVKHTGAYRFVCSTCGRGYHQRNVFMEHMATHTKEVLYTCERCGRSFSSNSTLRLHRIWHDNPLPYHCNICQRKFPHTSLLAVHKRRAHTGERPYKCPHCPMTFSVTSTRNKHVILHTRKFPYRCDACGKGVTTRTKLARHMVRAHGDFTLLNTKPPPCEYKMVLRPEEMPDMEGSAILDAMDGAVESEDTLVESVEPVIQETVLDECAEFALDLPE